MESAPDTLRTAPPPATGETHNGCPTPLTTPQVLDAFRTESRPWRLDRDGYSLTGRTWGAGPPLYFLNGLTGTHDLFALTAYLLREQFRCVLFDYPDDITPEARRRGSAESLAEDLLAIADRQGDERFAVFASSFGGLVALSAMRAAPQRVARAVLQAGYAHRALSPLERLLVRAGRFVPGCVRQIPGWRAIQEQSHRPWFPPFDAVRWPAYLENAGRMPIATLARRADIVRRTDLRGRLAEITQPVLLIRGEGEGRIATRYQDELQRQLPHARTESLHTTGHLPYLTHPHRLAKVIREFLMGNDQ